MAHGGHAASALRREHPVIFVTVGTERFPFQRLMDALRALPPADLVVQHGCSVPPDGVRRAVPFMSFDEMIEHYAAADSVVMHAGVGSFLCARRADHRPIVMARQASLGEHVDDHQVDFTARLAAAGWVTAVSDPESLADAVAHASEERLPGWAGTPAARPIHDAVRAALVG
jgi:UDP-N-acetylglucosamine transferase subunit ALG13